MAKYVTEMDVHVTSVIEIPDTLPQQLLYHELTENKGKVEKTRLAYIFTLLDPLVSNYDDVKVKDVKTFITEEDKNDEPGKTTESDGDVPKSGVEGESKPDA